MPTALATKIEHPLVPTRREIPTASARSVTSDSMAAEMTRYSAETDFVHTLLGLGRSLEGIGFAASIRFTRDDRNAITGVIIERAAGEVPDAHV